MIRTVTVSAMQPQATSPMRVPKHQPRTGLDVHGDDDWSDGDGWSDTNDAASLNATAMTIRADSMDASTPCGHMDNDSRAPNLSDGPEVYGTSTEDALGCPDTDGDGWSNSADAYPEDAAKHEASLLTAGPLPSVCRGHRGLVDARYGRRVLDALARTPPTRGGPVGPPLPPGASHPAGPWSSGLGTVRTTSTTEDNIRSS